MSSPSELGEPSWRPAIGQPAAVYSPYREAYGGPGHDYHYPDTLNNTSAGVAAGQNATEASRMGFNNSTNDGTAAHETGSSLRPDTANTKEIVIPENFYEPYREAPWYRRISRVAWLITTLTTLGIIAVLLAILGAMGYLSALCAPPTVFLTNITWTGPDGANSNTTFPAGMRSAEACCARCAGGRTPGCVSWMFRASAPYTPCVHVSVIGGGGADDGVKSDACPMGDVGATIFKQELEMQGFTAGLGPCGGEVVVKSE
ncbi:hypothetical protein BT67DRAFT_454591 [Trichocladium antarcticum]|uniref:Uncharacterized protein n=1 Tax=Trichocladium antarcticum TaxID=1450529 RepID=A0AAN6US45_9PEZI|nr:hypothetical protein BT67DRAFT_454591 [Trichocladium antarcticum]